MIDFNTKVGQNGLWEPKEGFTTFAGAIGDFGAGLGLSVVKGVEGVLELGNIIPGIDYDTKLVENTKGLFNYQESDSFAEQFGEFVGFAASLATGAGAVGKGASVIGRAAKGSKILRGYEESRAAQAAFALFTKHPKIASNLAINAKFAVADFLMTSGDDAFDAVSMLGLDDTAILEHFALEEGESELSRRLKGALQGFAVGVPIDFAFSSIGKAAKGAPGKLRNFILPPEVNEARSRYFSGKTLSKKEVALIKEELDKDLAVSINVVNVDSVDKVKDSIWVYGNTAAEKHAVEDPVFRKAYESEDGAKAVNDYLATLKNEDYLPAEFLAKYTPEQIEAGKSIAPKKGFVVADTKEARNALNKDFIDNWEDAKVQQQELEAVLGPPSPDAARKKTIAEMKLSLSDEGKALLKLKYDDGIPLTPTQEARLNTLTDEAFLKTTNAFKDFTIQLKAFTVEFNEAAHFLTSEEDKAFWKEIQTGDASTVDPAKFREIADKVIKLEKQVETLGLDFLDQSPGQQNLPRLFFDSGAKEGGVGGGGAVFDSVEAGERSVKILKELAVVLDKGEGTIEGKVGKIVDVAVSMKNNSSTVKESTDIVANGINEARRLINGQLLDPEVIATKKVQLRKDLAELNRISLEVDSKTPGLFRTDAPATEHIEIVEKLAGIRPGTRPRLVLNPSQERAVQGAGRSLASETERMTSDHLIKSAKLLSPAASPADKLSLTEFVSLRKNVELPTKAEVDAAKEETLKLLGEDKLKNLEEFSEVVAKAYGGKKDQVFLAYSQHYSSLENDFSRILQEPLSASLTQEKKDLMLLQMLDHHATLNDSISGITRPSALHDKRNLASLSEKEILNMSTLRLTKELERIGGKNKYNLPEVRKVLSFTEKFIGPKIKSISDIESSGFGWGKKTAELNIAMIMANTKLLSSNIIQNVLKRYSDNIAEGFGKFIQRKISGKVSQTFPVVNKVTLHKVQNGLTLWGRLTEASRKGQSKAGVGSLLADVGASREVRPTVSAFESEGKLATARNIGFIVAGASDDGSKALILIGDTLDQLSRRTDLSPEQFNLVQENLPKYIETRLKLGQKIKTEDLVEDVTGLINTGVDLSEKEAKEIAQALERETEVIINNAFDKAKEATFTTGQSVEDIAVEHGGHLAAIADVTRKIASGAEGIPLAGPIVRTLTVPFVNTPLNAMLYGSSLTPLSRSWWAGMFAPVLERVGPGKFPKLENILKLDFENDPKLAAKVGKAWMGSSIMAGTVALNYSGVIEVNGRGPSEPKAKMAWLEQGHKEYSIKVTGTDTEVSLKRLGPLAMPFIVAAEMIEYNKSNPWGDEAVTDQSKAMIAGGMEVFMGMSALDSSAKFLDALMNQDEAAINQIIAGIAIPGVGAARRLAPVAGVLPIAGSAGAFLSSFSDPIGKYKGDSQAAAIGSQIQNRYARFLPSDKRRNIYGEAIDTGFINSLGNAFGIVEFSTVKDSIINKELNALGMPVGKVSHIMSGLNLTEGQFAIGDQTAYDRLQENLGTTKVAGKTLQQTLEKLIRSSRYTKLSAEGVPELGLDSPRAQEVKKVFATFKASAKTELLRESKPLRDQLRTIEAGRQSLRSGKSPDSIIAQMFKI